MNLCSLRPVEEWLSFAYIFQTVRAVGISCMKKGRAPPHNREKAFRVINFIVDVNSYLLWEDGPMLGPRTLLCTRSTGTCRSPASSAASFGPRTEWGRWRGGWRPAAACPSSISPSWRDSRKCCSWMWPFDPHPSAAPSGTRTREEVLQQKKVLISMHRLFLS